MAPPVTRIALPIVGVAALIGLADWWTRTRTAEAAGRTEARLAPRRRHVAASAAGIRVG